MAEAVTSRHVEAVRRFNRFYTGKIGVLAEGHLNSPFSLTEVRVLYELAHRQAPTATALGRELGLDAGYLSRILRRFEKLAIVKRNPSPADGRQTFLELTASGRKAFAGLDQRAQHEIRAMLKHLSSSAQQGVVKAMRNIESALAPPTTDPEKAGYTLRPHQPGDMGWVVHRHGVLYAKEYGYDERFEALVAKIVADFIQKFDRQCERCWIADKGGEIVGSVFLVRKSSSVAKLRLLLVEPAARGLGIGRRLIDECVGFARQAGYKKITLWTQSELQAARHLYKQAGFHLAGRKRHSDFGKPSVAEVWDLKL